MERRFPTDFFHQVIKSFPTIEVVLLAFIAYDSESIDSKVCVLEGLVAS